MSSTRAVAASRARSASWLPGSVPHWTDLASLAKRAGPASCSHSARATLLASFSISNLHRSSARHNLPAPSPPLRTGRVVSSEPARAPGCSVPIFHPFLEERRVANQVTAECRQRSANPLPGKQMVAGLKRKELGVLPSLPQGMCVLERETRLEIATLCLGRLCPLRRIRFSPTPRSSRSPCSGNREKSRVIMPLGSHSAAAVRPHRPARRLDPPQQHSEKDDRG